MSKNNPYHTTLADRILMEGGADPWAIQRNTWLGGIADFLAKAKQFGNKSQIPIPYTGIQFGIGDLLAGESPEYLDKMADGFQGYTGSGQTARLDDAAIDVAGLPLPWAMAGKGLGMARKAAARGIQGAIAPAAEGVVDTLADPGRRAALEKMGKYAGAGVGAAVSGHPLMKAMGKLMPSADDVGTVAAKTAVKTAARAAKAFSTAVPEQTAAAANFVKHMMNAMPELAGETLDYYKKHGFKEFANRMADENSMYNMPSVDPDAVFDDKTITKLLESGDNYHYNYAGDFESTTEDVLNSNAFSNFKQAKNNPKFNPDVPNPEDIDYEIFEGIIRPETFEHDIKLMMKEAGTPLEDIDEIYKVYYPDGYNGYMVERQGYSMEQLSLNFLSDGTVSWE